MIGHYTPKKATKEIGNSISWRDGRKVAIKKWKEIIKYGEEYYDEGNPCGYCIVEENRKEKGLELTTEDCGKHCPATDICCKVGIWTPKFMLKKIRRLKR